MTNASAGFGASLKIGDGGSPVSYTTIAEVKDISGPEISLDTEDVTSHDSTDAWEEHIATIIRSGEVSFTINYDPSDSTHDNTDGLLNDLTNRKNDRKFRLVLPDSNNSQIDFTAIVTGFSDSVPVDGALEAEVTLKITGKPSNLP